MTKETPSPAYSRYALALLLAVNLLNDIDRQVLYAVFPLIKADFALSDTALRLTGKRLHGQLHAFRRPFGWLGDRWNRIRLASGGVAVWSLATALSGFAPGYHSLLAARTVGESVKPASARYRQDWSLISSARNTAARFFPSFMWPFRWGCTWAIFWAEFWGISSAGCSLLLVVAPGLFLAVAVWFLRDPGGTAPRPSGTTGRQSLVAGYGALFKNRSFVVTPLPWPP